MYFFSIGVDYEVLVSDEWAGEEVRLRLELATTPPDDAKRPVGGDPGEVGVDGGVSPPSYPTVKERDSAAAAAGLLRLFLHDLPHPLMPHYLLHPLLVMCKGQFYFRN